MRLLPSACRRRLRTGTSCSALAFASCLCSGRLSSRAKRGICFSAPTLLRIPLSSFNFQFFTLNFQLSFSVKQTSGPSPTSDSLDSFGWRYAILLHCSSPLLSFAVPTRCLRFRAAARHHHSSPQLQRPQKAREGAAPRTQRSLQFQAQRRRLLHHPPEEKATFFGLSTNEERDQFIEHFWCAAATCED
jgi:hypothetical protein